MLQNPLRGPRTGAKWRCVERVEFVDVGCVRLAAADHSSHCALSRYYAASVFVLCYYSASVFVLYCVRLAAADHSSHCALSQRDRYYAASVFVLYYYSASVFVFY